MILGGAGFIGNHLVRRMLQEPGLRVTVLDSLDPRFLSTLNHLKPVLPQIEFVKGDIRNPADLEKVIPGQHVVYHLAAQSSHTLAAQNPFLDTDINCTGTLHVLDQIRRLNPQAVLVYASTSTVIGKITGRIADENHPVQPLGIYSINKANAERYVSAFQRMHGIRTVILRFANLYGPFGKDNPEFGFMNFFIQQAQQKRAIQIFGSGDQLRNVMYVEDAADILFRASLDERLYGETFFAASPYHHTVADIGTQIAEVFEAPQVEHVPWPEYRLKIEVGDAFFSSEKLRAVTGWQARYTLIQGLERTLQIMTGESASVHA